MSDESGPRKSRFGRLFVLWIIGPLFVLAIGCVALIRNPPQPLLLDALANWIEDQLAAGAPAKWVAGQAVQACRYIASGLRTGELP